jgi:hypothetical protein
MYTMYCYTADMQTTEQDQSGAIARVLQENALADITPETLVDFLTVFDTIGSTFRVQVGVPLFGSVQEAERYEVTVRRIS